MKQDVQNHGGIIKDPVNGVAVPLSLLNSIRNAVIVNAMKVIIINK